MAPDCASDDAIQSDVSTTVSDISRFDKERLLDNVNGWLKDGDEVDFMLLQNEAFFKQNKERKQIKTKICEHFLSGRGVLVISLLNFIRGFGATTLVRGVALDVQREYGDCKVQFNKVEQFLTSNTTTTPFLFITDRGGDDSFVDALRSKANSNKQALAVIVIEVEFSNFLDHHEALAAPKNRNAVNPYVDQKSAIKLVLAIREVYSERDVVVKALHALAQRVRKDSVAILEFHIHNIVATALLGTSIPIDAWGKQHRDNSTESERRCSYCVPWRRFLSRVFRV